MAGDRQRVGNNATQLRGSGGDQICRRPVESESTIDDLVEAAGSRSRTDRTVVVAPGARPAVLAAMSLGASGIARATGAAVPHSADSAENAPTSSDEGTPLLVVTATGREAEQTAAALSCYLPATHVAVFPAWETLPHERLSPRADTVATRLAVLRRLAHPEDGWDTGDRPTGAAPSGAPDAAPSGAPDPQRGPIRVLVVPVRALLAPVVDGLGELEPVHLAKGLEVGLETTAERLAAAAYTRVDMVENRGEFAVRGGILDVFPPTLARPVRVDFFGDEIESVSTFAVADQRTIEEIDAVTATACREIVLTDAVRERARALVDVIPGAADMLGKIAEGINCEGMESLAPVLVERMVPLLDLAYEEDSQAGTDMNIVMTGSGDFIEVQGTAERTPFNRADLNQLLDLGAAGCAELTRLQREALA